MCQTRKFWYLMVHLVAKIMWCVSNTINLVVRSTRDNVLLFYDDVFFFKKETQ